MRGNHFYKTGRGLQLGIPIPGGMDNTIIGNQGSPTDQLGNRWIGPFQDVGAFHTSGNQFIQGQSQFFVDSNADLTYLPTTNTVGDNWFRNISLPGTTIYNCPSGLLPEPTDNKYDTNIAAILADDGGKLATWEAGHWLANYRVKRLLEKDLLDPADYSGLLNWENSLASTEIPDFYEAEVAMEAIGTASSTQENAYEALYVQLAHLDSSYADYAYQRYNDPSADAAQLATKMQETKAATHSSLASASSLLQSLQTSRQAQLAHARSKVNALGADSIFIANTATVYALTLDYLEAGPEEVLKSLTTLQYIATQCPLQGGEAVYTARSLLTILGEIIHIDDAQACQQPQLRPRAVEENTLSAATRVFPNPSRGQLQIQLATGGLQQLRLRNALGQVVRQQVLAGSPSSYHWQLGKLHSGTYVLEMETADGQQQQLIQIIE